MMRLAKEEQRKKIMKKKSNLKGRKEIVSEDWTWEERKLRWKIGEVARIEERKGSEGQVWTGYGKIKINEKW